MPSGTSRALTSRNTVLAPSARVIAHSVPVWSSTKRRPGCPGAAAPQFGAVRPDATVARLTRTRPSWILRTNGFLSGVPAVDGVTGAARRTMSAVTTGSGRRDIDEAPYG